MAEQGWDTPRIVGHNQMLLVGSVHPIWWRATESVLMDSILESRSGSECGVFRKKNSNRWCREKKGSL